MHQPLHRLTDEEQDFVKRLIAALPLRARSIWLEYLTLPGTVPDSAEQVAMMQQLHRKGWLDHRTDFFTLAPAQLTYPAWERFCLTEWREVEEIAMAEARGPDYGSW